MFNPVKDIINQLKKAKDKLRKAKKIEGNRHEKIGRLENEISLQENLWSDLRKKNNIPPAITNSALIFSKNIYDQSDDILKSVQSIEIEDIFSTTMLVSDTSISLVVSGAIFTYPSDKLPTSYYLLKKNLIQKSQQEGISQKLKAINPSLAGKYNNAWSALFTLPQDETRAPMFLMREVLTELYHHFAPTKKVRDFYKLKRRERVTRRHRIEYIVSQIENPDKRQFFLNSRETFIKIFEMLNKAHKQGKLDIEKTEGFLYQANTLIKLLLDSLN